MTSDDMLHSASVCGIWWLQHIHRVYNSSNNAISSALRAAQAYIRGVGGGWVGGGSLFELLGLVSKNNLSPPPWFGCRMSVCFHRPLHNPRLSYFRGKMGVAHWLSATLKSIVYLPRNLQCL